MTTSAYRATMRQDREVFGSAIRACIDGGRHTGARRRFRLRGDGGPPEPEQLGSTEPSVGPGVASGVRPLTPVRNGPSRSAVHEGMDLPARPPLPQAVVGPTRTVIDMDDTATLWRTWNRTSEYAWVNLHWHWTSHAFEWLERSSVGPACAALNPSNHAAVRIGHRPISDLRMGQPALHKT
jgi:hypothetical protein